MSGTSHGIRTNGQAQRGDVAIIGMSCIFPGAPDVRTYWENIIAGVDAVGDPPADWEAELFYDPASSANDRIYCKRGGFLGELARFDPLAYGVMPNSVDGGDPDQFLALRVAYEALSDAGYVDRPVDRERVEVIIGRGTYLNRGFMTLAQHGLVVDRVLHLLKQLHPEHTEAELHALKQELKASLPPFNSEMAPGLVPNVMSGRIANRLDLMGPNYTVDAACASSLIAIDRGMQDLLSGRCDLALVGGVHASTPAPILMVFCQLNALSRSGRVRSFDKNADGTLLGEGLGLIVLKRLEDAERDGDRIYALIKGIGIASDGRALGLLAPRIEGEELSLRRAYEATGIPPQTVELIEAHGTATPVGDRTEMQALSRVFGPRGEEPPWCAVGSVKSMISHLLPAAGIAGLIKTTLALYHKVLPPTLHYDEPNPELELDEAPFYINTATRPWIHGALTPRRAGVNAFGFGGINAHAILEEYIGTSETETVSFQHSWDTEVCILQGDTRQELLHQCEQLKSYLAGSPQVTLKDLAYTLNTSLRASTYRLSMVATSLEDVALKLAHALQRLSDPTCARIKDPGGLYFFEEPLGQQGCPAFLFPGEGSQYVNMLSDLCVHFPEVRAWFDVVDRAFVDHKRKYLPSQIIFPPPTGNGQTEQAINEERLWQMDFGPEAVFTANQAMFTLLNRLHIPYQAVVGHSTGESSALVAAGIHRIEDDEYLIRGILNLNARYEQLLEEGRIAQGVLLTVGGADRSLILALIEQHGDLYLAMDNCPHQLVLFGSEAAIERATDALRSTGAICIPLPFDRAYHTPLFKPFCEQLDGLYGQLKMEPPRTPLYSCTTAQLYPDDLDEIRKLAIEQWAQPVRFRETVEAMYEAGIRIFVEVGPRNNLTAFVDDILRGRPYLAVASNVPERSGITQLNHLLALLAAHGVPMRLDHLYARRAPQRLDLNEQASASEESQRAPHAAKLATGLQLMRFKQDLVNGRQDKVEGAVDSRPGAQMPVSPGSPSVGWEVSAGDGVPSGAPAVPASHQSLAADAAPAAIQSDRPSPLARTTPAPGAEHSHGVRSAVMEQYLQTMGRFLHLQQEVMRTFLNSAEAAVAPIQPFAENHAGCAADLPLPAPAPTPTTHAAPEPFVGTSPAALNAEVTAEPASEAVAPQRSPESIERILLQLVSERTGYPTDMLDLTMNLEADFGIDSIKRVEILGAFRKQTGLLLAQDMESLTRLKTLQQIIDFIVEPDPHDSNPPDRQAQSDEITSPARHEDIPQTTSPVPKGASFPFIKEVLSFVPGQELIARYRLNLDEDLYLRDHTLGSRVSVTDEALTALPVVPLTVSMEMLAEAAAALLPGKLVIGMKEVRAYRWIALDEPDTTLQLVARRSDTAPAQEITVQIYALADPSASGTPADTPLIEGIVVLGDSYSKPPQNGAFALKAERPASLPPEQLYTEYMFHGLSFRGVTSVDRWGEDGVEGTLGALPTERLLRSLPDPHFVVDPILLDAAGQLVGFWTPHFLPSSFHVFPFRVEALHLFGQKLHAGQHASCRLRIALVGEDQIRSDIDVIGPNGDLHARIEGWWDKRFDLPERFCRLRIAPQEALLSTPYDALTAFFPSPDAFRCCLINEFSRDFFEAHGNVWQRALAALVLSRQEREAWHSLIGPMHRRTDWLLGRAAAKDAVRLFLEHRYDLKLSPADIEIDQDEHGKPRVRGVWTAPLERVPVVSIAHTEGVAVAVAGDDGTCRGIGIDIEKVRRVREGFEQVAFSPEERRLLSSLGDLQGDAWLLRFWCAKEAVAKAVGRGLLEGPQALHIQEVDHQTGRIMITLSDTLAKEIPNLAAGPIVAYTVQENEIVFASALLSP